MSQYLWRSCALSLCILLTACGAPRGAGFQSEVLKAADSDTQESVQEADFQVVPVTRETYGAVASWPDVNTTSYSWLGRQRQPASMLLAPGDKVTVTVWDTEDYSLLAGAGQRVAQLQEVEVGADGRIFLPFIGDMRVAGMSQSTMRDRIEEQYAATIPSAQVQVQVEPGRANTANLVAGVGAPGVYPLMDRDVSLLSLVAMGGGVAPQLTNPQVRLFRGNSVYGIALSRLYDDPALDTTVRGGDRIIVEEETRTFLSLGAAGTEALHVFPKEHLSALEALSVIGGVADERANPKGILVLREYDAHAVGKGPEKERVVFTLDLTTADGLFSAGKFEIMPDDLVYATESPVTATRTILGLLGAAVGLSNRL